MNLDRYEYLTNETFLDFEFCSEGPKGKIKKIVRYSPQNANGITYFNLAFGDWDEEKKQINDKVITNNQDTEKILATIASTVLDFTNHFPDVPVYAKGSTPARTRLYQMGILANFDQIEQMLNVYGFFENNWSLFKKNINYEAFLTLRK
ncbi:DUF6934 family protein [Chitinophagaceae bacterium LWZ2-11]